MIYDCDVVTLGVETRVGHHSTPTIEVRKRRGASLKNLALMLDLRKVRW